MARMAILEASTQNGQLPEVGFSSLLIRWIAVEDTGARAMQRAVTAAMTWPTFLLRSKR